MLVQSYEGDTKLKRAKLQTYRIQYETLKMHEDERITNVFLGVDRIVKTMDSLGDEIMETIIVENILRSLTPKFDSKVFTIKEMQDFNNLTLEHLHRILITYEMRKQATLGIRQETFKATKKGNEK